MKTNEIIASLRCCVVNSFTSCKECPMYSGEPGCINRLHTAAADMLEAQQKRIEELEAEREKPLTAFLSPIDAYKGLKRKFLVFKSDTGEMVENCFVLRPGKDPAAVEALRAYASATDNATLSADIFNWIGAGEGHCWIPVTERLPEPDTQVLAIVSGRWENITFDRAYELASWSADEGWIMEAWPELEDPEVTHWMPLPEPPKEGV